MNKIVMQRLKNNKQNQHIPIGGILYIYKKDKQIEQTVTLLSISNCCYLYIYIWYLYYTLFFIIFIFIYLYLCGFLNFLFYFIF